MRKTSLLLVSSLVSSSPAVPPSPLPSGPEAGARPSTWEHFACLSHYFSRTSLTRSPKPPRCPGVGQLFPVSSSSLFSRAFWAPKQTRVTPSVAPGSIPVGGHLRLIGDVPDSRESVSGMLNLEHSSVHRWLRSVSPQICPAFPFHVLHDGQKASISWMMVLLTLTGPWEGVS